MKKPKPYKARPQASRPPLTAREQEHHDLEIATAYGKLRDHLEKVALTRTRHFIPERADAFAMFALIQTGWDLAVKLHCETQFMTAIGKLTGANVEIVQPTQEEAPHAPVIPSDESGTTETDHGATATDQGTTRH